MSNDIQQQTTVNIQEKAILIWAIADKLVGVYKPHEYGNVIGAHFTARDIIYLMAELLVGDNEEQLEQEGITASIYDMAMGTSQMLGNFLLQKAQENIEGTITIDDVTQQVRTYYLSKTSHDTGDRDKEEADRVSANIAKFTSGLWQIHAFCEGNTRTTAVFLIQYLRSIGFHVNNDMFARHSWYFRNALVRANYKNVQKGIDYTPIYLERFFRNLLLDDGWELRNKYLHICPPEEWKEQPNLKISDQTNPTSTRQVGDK